MLKSCDHHIFQVVFPCCIELVSNILDICCHFMSMQCCWHASVVGLVTSLSASFTRWRSNGKDKRLQNSSVVSEQSVISAVSDILPSVQLNSLVQNACETSLHADIAATPKLIQKRRAADELQPFSATKKLVCH